MLRRFALFLTLGLAATAAHAEVTIDGRIDPGEWVGAKHITDFRDTQPKTGKPGSQPTEAWVLSTPKGLAVAIRVTQPAGIPRTQQQTRRDEDALVDRINVMVDFDGDGRVGYDFEVRSKGGVADEVITNESDFSYDWDGRWDHAVTEDADGYSVEILIPWYVAQMRRAKDGERTIGLYIDRIIAGTGERMAWPTISFDQGRFLSAFEKVSLPSYSQSLFAATPYIVGKVDRAHGGASFEQGADILWKPNGQTQLTATINPDFGQVESDDLVVNFSPEETFFTDKRPFFTENQGIFDFSLLDDYSQLVYTRRVGGAADDGSGKAADIAAAVKVNGSVGDTSYGILTAQEKGDAGRSFGALRLTRTEGTQTFGMLATRVNHPYLDRDANVLGFDHRWQPSGSFTITSNVVGSKIDQPQANSSGLGATSIAFWEMDPVWSQQWLGMYFGRRLDIDDFGYLPRNDMAYLHWEVRRRDTDLPADSAYSSHLWRYRISGADNTGGLPISRRLRIQRDSRRRDGGNETLRLDTFSAAYDDLLTRGGNALHTPPTAKLMYERTSPRIGRWSWEAEGYVTGNQLTGYHRLGYYFKFVPTYFITDAFSIFAGPSYEWDPNWLIWQDRNLVGAFDGRTVGIDSGVNWNFGNRQELRVKLQTLAVGAELRHAYEIDRQGRARPSSEPVDDLGVANLGFQIRYRFEIAPLSNLYIVYNRGGYEDDAEDDLNSQFRRGFALKDVEEGLVKVAYRLEF